MKKYIFLLFLIPFYSFAQHTITGTIVSKENYTYALLYKIEGVRQLYLQSTGFEKDTIEYNGRMEPVQTFQLTLPDSITPGSYRIAYDPNNNGVVDVLFNKEDIAFTAIPQLQRPTVVFQKSIENNLYEEYIKKLSAVQYTADSLQIVYLKQPSESVAQLYTSTLSKINAVQKSYEEQAKGKLVYDFIVATTRYNAPTVVSDSDAYFDGIVAHFYDAIDFSNKTLYNSSFLVDRISDYVFYMNFADDEATQKKLHKSAIDRTLQYITNDVFKSDIIVFLMSQFANAKDAEITDYLIQKHFNALPVELQDIDFKMKVQEQLGIAVGRIAPDFSWDENGKSIRLSSLTERPYYLLIFYSTECSHCLREVPQIYKHLEGTTQFSVVAFAMETTPSTWTSYIKTLPGWHHALGLNKWENKIARTYQINATPTYLILDASKKIIGLLEELVDLKKAIDTLKE